MLETLINIVFTLFQAPVSWRSTIQSTVSLSTTKAEYMAMMDVMKEAISLQRFLNDLGIDQALLKINYDSINAIYLAKNQVYHATTKHIDVRFHFVREILDESDIELQKIQMKENPADMFNKVVQGVKFAYYKELLQILPVA